jgi:hypothetical protein
MPVLPPRARSMDKRAPSMRTAATVCHAPQAGVAESPTCRGDLLAPSKGAGWANNVLNTSLDTGAPACRALGSPQNSSTRRRK